MTEYLGKILLLQREIPEYVNVIAAKIAREAGTLVILDMGGRDELLSPELIHYIDIISPNEVRHPLKLKGSYRLS